MDRIVLGGVQFGLPYGVSNQTGQVSLAEAEKIISYAYQNGLRQVDTAYAYGESEAVLGQILGSRKYPDLRIITKTMPKIGGLSVQDVLDIAAGFETSLQRLQQDNVYSLMLHRAENLLMPGKERIFDYLQDLKAKGIIQKIACSFYSPEDLMQVLEWFDLDLIQVPGNVFDQRFLQPKLIELLQAKHIEIHVRSLFLQGLLFYVEDGALPAHMRYAKPYLDKLKQFCLSNKMDVLELALRFGLSQPRVKLVLGVAKLQELKAIQQKLDYIKSHPLQLNFAELALEDLGLIDPTKWPNK